jgi:uncharacterized repeat protein (TIGR01451 family)
MSKAVKMLKRSACLSGLLHLVCAVVLTSGLFPLSAFAATFITNTAGASFTAPDGSAVTLGSNTTDLRRIPDPDPSSISFYQYAPGASGSMLVDGGQYDTGGGSFASLPPVSALDGSAINLAAPVPVQPTHVFHAGEPIFITLTDSNRNLDDSVREFVTVTVTTSTGDTETLRLEETGPATGIFAAVIQSTSQAAATNDGKLSVGIDTTIKVHYTDIYYPGDVSSSQALVDPYGIVFDSATGVPVEGATVTIIDNATNAPALVYGDDGHSTFPSTVTVGSALSAGSPLPATASLHILSRSVTDSGGTTYTFPPGGFRFPVVSPGSYHYLIKPPTGYLAPSTVPSASMPLKPDGSAYAVVAGSRSDTFIVQPGPALNIDVPVDPQSTGLVVTKTVSQTTASAGDFLQYQLVVQNVDAALAAHGVNVVDVLPVGMRYQAGSLRVNGVRMPDPQIDSGGRTLHMPLGTIAASTSVQIHYVVMLGAGVSVGSAVNSAQASGTSGNSGNVITSNMAQVAVTVRPPFFTAGSTIIGRVYEGDCNTPWDQLKAVPNARLLMEDGSYVVTDKDGQYHFEGVTPGTHVVQLDVDSLAGKREPISCVQNTRFAGRSFSQFVEVQGGTLWRADFFTKPVTAQPATPSAGSAEVGIRMASQLAEQNVTSTETGDAKTYTVHAEFDSCSANLNAAGLASLGPLIATLKGQDVASIELIGHTDNQRLSKRCQVKFKDNYALSKARAQAVGDQLVKGLGLRSEQVGADGHGPDQPAASNATAAGMARNRRTEVIVHLNRTSVTRTTGATVTGLAHHIDLDGSAAVSNLSVMAMLPAGTRFIAGSATLDDKPLPDPDISDGIATFRIGSVADASWKRALGFAVQPDAAAPDATRTVLKTYNVHARFASCSTVLQPGDMAAITRLARELGKQDVARIELLGHTDNQHLSGRCKAQFKDNKGLSQARAQVVGQELAKALKLDASQIVAAGDGEDHPVASNADAKGRALNRRTEVIVYGKHTEVSTSTSKPLACAADGYEIKALASFEAVPGKRLQTPLVNNQLTCSTAATAALTSAKSVNSERKAVTAMLEAPKASTSAERLKTAREQIMDDVTASGAKSNWLDGQTPGYGWIFPALDYNPRSPATRIVIKHAADQKVVLKGSNGEAVSALNFDGTLKNADKSIVVSVWRGVPLVEGDNVFTAEVLDADGKVVQTLSRNIVYANTPVRAELVPEESSLVADGITRPVIALRLLDRNGRPVRAGVSGAIDIGAPYVSWQQVDQEQKRALAGMDRFQAQYQVEGDKGIAYVELAPTTDSGAVRLNLNFQTGPDGHRAQQLQAWMEPGARNWVVVGFAQGTVGYNTLQHNLEPLAKNAGVKDGSFTNDQVSFYAKGRVLGKWLLTMAYNTDKPSMDGANGRPASLLSTIDPNRYYTIYGDGTAPRYDASSASKLYLKLERGQFYALFGDYSTGLTQTQLSRYNRTLTGIKMENGEGPLTFIMFGAETPQNYARDEIQGNGTSGLYRLSHGGIILNSEQIHIETRDRLHSENIVQSTQLTPHIDYEIDYDNGTIFFKQPVNSRDFNFNPTFIVAEYETLGVAGRELDAGGRAALSLNQGKVVVGMTAIHDEQNQGKSSLGGADLKVKLSGDSELRVETARTDSSQTATTQTGSAWLAEYEHHDGKADTLVYTRNQATGFGLNQQNAAETGEQKSGVTEQYRFDKNWSVQGDVYNQVNHGNDDQRNAVSGKLQYKNDEGGVGVGAQFVNDQAPATSGAPSQSMNSDQATITANRFFYNRKLELTGEVDTSLGAHNGSLDYPDRYVAGAGYAITDNVRALLSQEITDGNSFDTSTTRTGLQVTPWKGAHLESTLNQTEISENGPRTFGELGLTQGLILNENWGMDFSTDSSHTFRKSGKTAPVLNSNEPIAASGTLGPTLTEDYNALSTGATYRTEIWSWNGRAEMRLGDSTTRHGLVSNFLRQAQAGVALASSAQAFRTDDHSTGTSGTLLSADVALAWRPLGVQWSLLDRFELRYNGVENGSGTPGSGVFGNNSLVTTGNATTRHLINNVALNHVSREWTEADRQGNLFSRYERSQWSLYYGAKYAVDNFDGAGYSGYTDLLGLEARHDLTSWLDIGAQASVLNGWSTHTHAYSFGPAIGASPVTNGWITLGYNFKGFQDRDFDAARYSAQGIYLQLRIKFDQNTRIGHADRDHGDVVQNKDQATMRAAQ